MKNIIDTEKRSLIERAVEELGRKEGKIDLIAKHIGDDGVELLLNLLKEKGTAKDVRGINLYYNKISDEGIKHIINFLKDNKGLKIQEIRLGDNPFSVEVATELLLVAEAFEKPIKIIFPEELAELNKIQEEHNNKSLIEQAVMLGRKNGEINLIAKDIGNKGVELLLKLLKEKGTAKDVREIKLCYNKISDEGVQYIINFLKDNKSLKIQHIYLDGNPFSVEVAKELWLVAEAFEEPIKIIFPEELAELDKIKKEREKNSLIKQEVERLGLKEGKIDLMVKHIGDKGVQLLFELLKEKGTAKDVIKINLFNNEISDEGIKHIINFLKDNKSLKIQQVCLDGNNVFSVEAAKELLEAAAGKKYGKPIKFIFPEVLEKKITKEINAYNEHMSFIGQLYDFQHGSTLVLSGNSITAYRMENVIKFLQINKEVKNITLDNCLDDDNALKILANFLNKNSIVNLSFQGQQRITVKGAGSILEALKNNAQAVLGKIDFGDAPNDETTNKVREMFSNQIRDNKKTLCEEARSIALLLNKKFLIGGDNRLPKELIREKILPSLLPEITEGKFYTLLLFKPYEDRTIEAAREVIDFFIRWLMEDYEVNVISLPKGKYDRKISIFDSKIKEQLPQVNLREKEDKVKNLILSKLTGQPFFRTYIFEEFHQNTTEKLGKIYTNLKISLLEKGNSDCQYSNALLILEQFRLIYKILETAAKEEKEGGSKKTEYQKLFDEIEKLRDKRGLAIDSKNPNPNPKKEKKCTVM